MIGQRRLPMFSKNQVYEVSSQGSPVEPSSRSVGRAWRWAESLRISKRMAVGEIPNVVMPCRSMICHNAARIGIIGRAIVNQDRAAEMVIADD